MPNDYYQLIADEKELKWFFDNIIPPLENDEVYFLSLSARSKLLTDEQKEKLQLGRTEMFERRIVREREWSRFLRTVKKFETAYGSYTTKNGSLIPNKAIVVYFNINPSNVIKAYNEFSQIMNDYMFELAMCAMRHRDTTDIMHRIKKQDVLLMNCYQKNKGTKHWLDFDFDVPKNEITLGVVEEFVSEVRQHKGTAYIIETQGGYHVLVSKNTEFDEYFHPGNIADNYYRQLGMHVPIEDAKIEVIHNKNSMIPLPGIIHHGTVVRVLNKGE